MVAGLAGFVDGVFKGMDWAEIRNERKRKREMEDTRFEREKTVWGQQDVDRTRRHGFEDSEEGRTNETHGWRRDDHGWMQDQRARTKRIQTQEDADRAAERQAYADAAAEAEALSSADPRAPQQPEDAAPVEDPRSEPPPAEPPRRTDLPDGRGESVRGAREAQDAPQHFTYEAWRKMSRAERQKADLPVSELGGQLYFNRFSVGMGAEPPRKAGQARQDALEAERAAQQAPEGGYALTSPTGGQSIFNRVGFGLLTAQPQQGTPQQPPKAGGAEGAFVGETPAPAAAPALTPAADANGKPTLVTEEGTPAPSTEIATKAARPLSGVLPATDGQRERGSKDFLENYAKSGSQKVIKHYISTGQVEKAEAFKRFIDDTNTKSAMRHWSRAAHAAAIGDADGFARYIAQAYNAAGYYDDGYSIVEDKTTFDKDGQGNIVSGTVTFRNEETGETFEQTLQGREQIFQMGLGLLAPEAVFDEGWKRMQEERAARAGAASKSAERASDPKAMAEVMKLLSEASIEFSQLPHAQQMQVAADFMRDPQGTAARLGMDDGGAATGQGNIPFLP